MQNRCEKGPPQICGLQPLGNTPLRGAGKDDLRGSSGKLEEFKTLAKARDVEATAMGEFTNTGKFHVLYGKKTIAYLDIDFMHDGLPRMKLKAKWNPPRLRNGLRKRDTPKGFPRYNWKPEHLLCRIQGAPVRP